MGRDLYSSSLSKPLVNIPNIHHVLTERALQEHAKQKKQIPVLRLLVDYLCLFLAKYSLSKRNQYNDYIKAVERVDFFSCVIPYEYNFLKNLPFFHAELVDYKHYNMDSLGKVAPVNKKKNKILIGNSGVSTNNHLDTFELLKNIDLKEYELLLPFNYGASDEWRNLILTKGKEYFGTKLKPLTDYIPRASYFEMIDECSHAIFYHERQQAMGNVYHLLETGCKLFLSEDSVTYKYLKDSGVHVFSIQSDFNQENINTRLGAEEANANNAIVVSLVRDKQRAVDELNTLYEKISTFRKQKLKK